MKAMGLFEVKFPKFWLYAPSGEMEEFMQKSKYVLVDVLADIGTGFCLDCLVWYFEMFCEGLDAVIWSVGF